MAKSYKAYGEIEITDISDSKQLTSFIESQLQRQVIYDPNDRVYLPNYATTNNILTPQLFITGNMNNIVSQAKSVSWFYQVNSIGNKIPITGNTTDYTLNTTTKQLTIKTNVLQNNISMNYIAEIVYTDPDTEMDVKTISTIELLKITNGVDGIDGDNPIVAVLSNESHTIPADADGLNMNFSGANTEIKIYDGVRDATSEWTITASPSTGIAGNLATTSGFVYTVTNMTLDSGYVNFTAKKGLVTLTKRFTLTKVRRGITGADGRTPVKGTDYFDGINGQDGKSSFLWVMYSQNANGSGMTETSTNAKYIGLATTQTNTRPTLNTNYTWSLIKGTDGIKGETGTDGKTSYLHIKYSDNGTSFTTNNGETMGAWIGTYVDFVEVDSTTFSSYSWMKVKGENGEQGLRGLQGETGAQGIAGVKGADGKTPYTHIAYANSADGVDEFSTSDSLDKAYIGMYTDFTQDDSANPSLYNWTLVKGADGAQGIAGVKGTDGKTPYLHIAYANNGNGSVGFSTTDSVGKTYIGQYTDYLIDDSDTPSLYSWTLIKGDKGEAGSNAQILYLSSDAEAMTFDGLNNPSPVTQTISITAKLQNITGTPAFVASPYNQAGAKLTDITLGGTGTTRTLTQAQWLSTFARVVITATLGSLTDKITIVKLSSGANGRDGLDGLDGDQGIAGKDGVNAYTHIAYANNSTGTSGFSTSDGLNKTYIGMYTDDILTDSTDPTKYKWTLIKGADGSQGIAGAKGADGLTPYFHIAYATNSTGSSGFSTTISDGKTYIGQYTDYLSADSDDPKKYSWTLIKGLDGTNGTDAIVGYLTNESATLGASSTGVVGDFSGASGIFKVFDGIIDKTGTSVAYSKVSNTGCTATIGANGAYSVSAMTADNATVVMTATYKTVVVTKTLVLSKSKTGTTGTAGEGATSYWLTNSVGVIKRNDAGVYSPTTITVNSLSQTGTSAPTAYAGRFIISETINGTTWVDKYTSSVNESTKIYTPSAGILSLRVRMYLAGGVTSLVDEQNIPVVADGSDPIFAILTTPLGSIIKNSTGNLTIEANLYKGSTLITPASYKWYKLDTTVSGGWRQLTASVPDGTTGYTGRILTVTPSSITSLATFKVEAIYNGLTYSNMITLTDLSDPISCIIIGSGIYKNGQGTNSYIARLYRNGSEIDVSGTIYLYKWNLLNKDGTLNAGFTATGKTISIPATAFDDTAQLKCDVDDKK